MVLLGNKKGDLFSKFQKEKLFVKKKKNLPALMAFAETETKVTKTLLPFVDHNVKVSWQRRDASNNIDAVTLESFQMPTPTLELSTARKNVVKSATAECMTALDMPSLHSSVWEPTTTAFTARVPKLSARDELGPLHVVLLVDKEELVVWSVAATKDLV